MASPNTGDDSTHPSLLRINARRLLILPRTEVVPRLANAGEARREREGALKLVVLRTRDRHVLLRVAKVGRRRGALDAVAGVVAAADTGAGIPL
eukprot:scaffold748_cov251-Pinguiococcus_pyrenoidosus.AAC.41